MEPFSITIMTCLRISSKNGTPRAFHISIVSFSRATSLKRGGEAAEASRAWNRQARPQGQWHRYPKMERLGHFIFLSSAYQCSPETLKMSPTHPKRDPKSPGTSRTGTLKNEVPVHAFFVHFWLPSGASCAALGWPWDSLGVVLGCPRSGPGVVWGYLASALERFWVTFGFR